MTTSGFLVGLLVVTAFVRARFDRPASVRSDTTASWYYFGLTIYVAAFVFPYSVVAAYSVLRLPGWTSPLLIATAVALVAPKLPPLSWADAWLHRRLHDMIGARTVARRLADDLFDADFHPAEEVQSDVRLLLKRRGYDPEESWLPPAEPMRALWLRAAMVFQQVRRWDEDGAYRDFVQATPHEFDRLRTQFDHLSLKVVRALRTVDRLGGLYCELAAAAPASPAPQAGKGRATGSGHDVKLIVDEVLADTADDVASFLRELCLYVARGVLAGGLTSKGRRRRLTELGFTLDRPLQSIPSLLGWSFLAYLTLFVGFMVAPLLLPGAGAGTPSARNEWLVRVLMIVTIQVSALAIAILPKEFLGLANEDFRGRPPLLFIAGAGLAAMVAGSVLQLVFLLLMHHADAAVALEAFRTSAPWLLTALATASVTAFLIQDSRWSTVRSRHGRRLLDATTMALALMLAVQAAVALGAPTRLQLPWRLALAMLIGLVIGGTVPGARRRPLVDHGHGRPARPRRARSHAAPSGGSALGTPARPVPALAGHREPAAIAHRSGERASPG